ncbi:zinc finger, C2H2 type [Cooperia oncophora]
MRLHVRAIHTPEVKYMCEVCDRLFKTTAERRHHMTRMHMIAYRQIVDPVLHGQLSRAIL